MRPYRASKWKIRRQECGFAATAAFALAACACGVSDDAGRLTRASSDYSEVAVVLSAAIERERVEKGLAAVSIALVDGDDVAWAEGFGARDASGEVPAAASTVYRVGSVSKLFTDIAIMQLVESGRMDLDVPVRTYLPGFAPDNRWDTPITLRHLMAHRSGLIREPPAGHYFDDGGTDLAATVASLTGTPLVYEPGARTKYSNAGIAVVGYALEAVQGEPFDRYLHELATGLPAGMVGGYDEFSPRSFPDYPGGTSRQRWLRELLRRTMEAEGFTVYEAEWWHFDHDDWREYGIQNVIFNEITAQP